MDTQREKGICESKRYFGAEHLARDYAMLVSWKYPDSEQPDTYRCPWCDGWHMTTPPWSERRRERGHDADT